MDWMINVNWLWLFLIVLVVSGAAVSAYEARQRRLIKAAPPDLRMCSCGHGFGTHASGQNCKQPVKREHYMDGGSRNGHEWVMCPCLVFDGVRPLNAEEIVRGWSPPEVTK